MLSQGNSLTSLRFSSIHVFYIITGLMELRIQTLKKQEWTDISWRNNVYNDEFRVDTRLEHGFTIDYAYFQ